MLEGLSLRQIERPVVNIQPTLVMLDLDGTLIDSIGIFLSGLPAAAARHGVAIAPADVLRGWGEFVVDVIRRKAGDEDRTRRVYADFERFFFAEHDRLAIVFPGVAEGLFRLRAAVQSLGVVTSRPRPRADLIHSFPWSKAIDFLISGDDAPRKKPFPDALDTAIQRHGAGCTRFIYLGDSWVDIEAAHRSRTPILAAAACWGRQERGRLMASRPDACFADFLSFVEWVEKGEALPLTPSPNRRMRKPR
jgi:phosphoglycolate phosphatase-like HAD superfamily hydrolase